MEDKDINYIKHLEEMRKRIIITLGSFLVAACGAFLFAQDIYSWLVRDMEGKLVVLGPSDILSVYLVIAGVFAVAITIPVAGTQLWKFLKPGLTKSERRATLMTIPALAILFAIGICFGYFIVFPTLLSFLKTMGGDQVNAMYTTERYFSFMANITLPFGFLFDMPAVVMFLTKLGLLNPLRLAKARKLSYFILVVISTAITPPDFMSDIIVTIPLLILYEASITLSKLVYRKRIALSSVEQVG